MQIPQYFLDKASRQFGDAGPPWVAQLPGLLAECEAQWELSDLIPAEKLSINLVAFAHSARYGDVVLKIGGPHNERLTEIITLQMLSGGPIGEIVALNEDKTAMLLERVAPGGELRNLPDRQKQIEIGTDLIKTLPRRVDQINGLPLYSDWIYNAFELLPLEFDISPEMLAMVATAGEIFPQICPPELHTHMLHGDLHHDNILQHGAHGWKVIDPQGVIGPHFMEAPCFIRNHFEDFADPEFDRVTAYFADKLGEQKATIAKAVFVMHVLSTMWGYEMYYTDARIAKSAAECQVLLDYVNQLE